MADTCLLFIPWICITSLMRPMGLYIVQLLSLRHQSINRELPLLKSPAPLYIRRYSFPLKSRTDHHPTKVYRKAIHGSG